MKEESEGNNKKGKSSKRKRKIIKKDKNDKSKDIQF